ncbi:hypothetical protein D1007_25293 [Hordeum vulgare]|nr:hypothetical protein D1007_25293 [Hordeum vulgare]
MVPRCTCLHAALILTCASGWDCHRERNDKNRVRWEGIGPPQVVSHDGTPASSQASSGNVLRMADDGPWYDGLIEEFDRVHRGREIENRKDVVAMRMRGHAANDFCYDVRYEPYIARYSRRNNQDISVWAAQQQSWIAMWNQRERFIENEERPHNDSAYQEYLVWYAERYRLKPKLGWTREEWSELVSKDPSAAEGYHAFNMAVRETGGSQVDYAPMHDELGREFLLCVNDANVALRHPPGGASSERTLRTVLEKFRSRFHKWEAMLSCHGARSKYMNKYSFLRPKSSGRLGCAYRLEHEAAISMADQATPAG